jgi:peptidoglycan/xylan/chitin deacetylase (PgdA/CDA1 family)
MASGSASTSPKPIRPSSPHATAPRTSAPPATLPQWLAGPVITRLPTTHHVVALTFDGGAAAQGANSILQTLRKAAVPATFFLTGRFAAANPQFVDTLADSGYLIGNHTMTHPHLTGLTSTTVVTQITRVEDQFKATTGGSLRPWFRFPYGEYDARTLGLVHHLGYGAIGWTVDTRGWQGRTAGTAQDVVARVRAALRPGAIVLMHHGANPDDATTFDADALPAVIAMIRAEGYGFVDLAS